MMKTKDNLIIHFKNNQIKKMNRRFLNKRNLYLTLSSIISTSLIWIIFKHYYPNPNLNFDSYYYIYAAEINSNINIWPIGYSKFLSAFNVLSKSSTLLVAFQYILLQLSLLYFLILIANIFSFNNKQILILFIILFFNPIYPFTANLILSDTLFLMISLLWFLNLMWIVIIPTPKTIIIQLLLLIIAFTIRNNALYYPIITITVLLISNLSKLSKIIWISITALTIGISILISVGINQKANGVTDYSGFQGWRLSNNALYAYEHVTQNDLKPMPQKFRQLDIIVRKYFNSNHKINSLTTQDPSSGCFYIFNYPSPLLIYRDYVFGKDKKFILNINTVAKLGPLYKEYGTFLIKEYPIEYFIYFIIPSFKTYMYPYPEVYADEGVFYQFYNDTLRLVSQKFFPSLKISYTHNIVTFRSNLFNGMPNINLITHNIFFLSVLLTLIFKTYKEWGNEKKQIVVIYLIWFINFIFIITTSASVLRFQLLSNILEWLAIVISFRTIIPHIKLFLRS